MHGTDDLDVMRYLVFIQWWEGLHSVEQSSQNARSPHKGEASDEDKEAAEREMRDVEAVLMTRYGVSTVDLATSAEKWYHENLGPGVTEEDSLVRQYLLYHGASLAYEPADPSPGATAVRYALDYATRALVLLWGVSPDEVHARMRRQAEEAEQWFNGTSDRMTRQ